MLITVAFIIERNWKHPKCKENENGRDTRNTINTMLPENSLRKFDYTITTWRNMNAPQNE